MNLILVLFLIVLAIFASFFIAGMIKAGISGSNKKRRAFALVTISQLSENERDNLVKIYSAFRDKNKDKVNQTVESLDKQTLQSLIDICGLQNRPPQFSAGKFGDNLSWTAMESEYQKLGYSENASKIITGIILHDYDSILNKLPIND